MVELTTAFLTALQAAGIHARAAKSAELSPRLEGSAVAVSVAELTLDPGGFCDYLGIHEGQELYGRRLRAKMRLDVLSPTAQGAGACRTAVDAACAVLAGGIEGVSITAITSRAPAYDKVGDCFCAAIEADCHGWLCAAPMDTDDGLLEHFILKGALT